METSLTTEEMLRRFFEENPTGFFTQEELAQKLGRDQSSISRAIKILQEQQFLKEFVVVEGKARIHYIGRKYPTQIIKRLAMRYWVGPGIYEYAFTFDLKRLLKIAKISRARYVEQQLEGFQRDQQRNWINELASKLDSPTSYVTDPITICLDNKMVTWTPLNIEIPEKQDPLIHQPELGILNIPYNENPTEDEKCAILVDGQQRSLAALKTKRDRIPIYIVGYLVDLSNDRFLIDEFIKNNSHKNLPPELLDILAPHASEEVLPGRIRRRLPADQLAEQLNNDPTSPFYMKIKSSANPQGIIALRSVVDMIQTSERTGFLQPLNPTEEKAVLDAYWTAVANVFKEAWNKPPEESKLTHGAGIYALGQLMDQILPRVMDKLWTPEAVPAIEAELRKIADKCLWTQPADPAKMQEWESDWKPLQNLKRDKEKLAKRLKLFYLGR
ncbi:MAG: DGQHR domain-containing protein [Archaeoglobaceae archaeon]